jgi:hypothetical protein
MRLSILVAAVAVNICGAAESTMPTAIRPAANRESGWWPTQAMPKAIVRTTNWIDFPAPHAACEMMVQSVAGLAAKAANEGRGDELVWVGTGHVDVEDWFARMLKRHPRVETHGIFDPWSLVDRYAKRGLIKGYILYRMDTSKGGINEHRLGMDCSVNVATSLAGILDGIIVDEALEAQAQQRGLKMLIDIRNKTQAWCFETYKEQFSRAMVCTQDPRKSNVRDLAIAQRAFTVYGYDAPTSAVMKWLAPLSPILGWNGGDEFKTTDMSSRQGHIQTATDWCINLPVLMAATDTAGQSKTRNLDPKAIDWSDTRSAVSFISTDGDNMQWFEGNFFRTHDSKSYWSNPQRGKIPFGWSCCFAHLAQLCPEAIDYAVSTQSPNDSFVEWGGGYYFPDLFAIERADRWELLAQHARRTWALMQKNDTRIIGFNVAKLDSPDALKAYEVFARQTDGLLAILVFQYERYEAGAGKVFWVKDRNGVQVPVISARYSIWSQSNVHPRAGTPAKVARVIRETVESTQPDESPRYDWVIAHVWSWFKPAPGSDENAEDMPQEKAAAHGGVRGYTPVTWCTARLPSNIRTVSPEELIWRIRMKHNPEETKRRIATWPH